MACLLLPCLSRALHWRVTAGVSALIVGLVLAVPVGAEQSAGGGSDVPSSTFLNTYCYDCHQGSEAEAGLDLMALSRDLSDPAVQQRWVRIIDRVHDGEMPPPEMGAVEREEAAGFLQASTQWLRDFQRAQYAESGRVRGRRLTRRELERSLHDLLGIDVPLADQLPQESQSSEFTTVADGQTMSHFQLERHLAVVDRALEEAFRRALTPEDRYERNFSAREVARRSDRRRTREPEIIDGRAVVWSSNLIFYGRIPATTAPEDGWYRFTVRVAGLKQPDSGGVWSTIRSGLCVSSAPLLMSIAAFEATEAPKEVEFEAWLPKRHMLEIRPGDTTLKKARFAGGQVGSGEGEPQNVPGIAIERITMERFHRGPDDGGVRQLLFGELEVNGSKLVPETSVTEQRAAVAHLLERFASRAFRRPVAQHEITGYIDMALERLDQEQDLVDALRVGYRAVLCSPRFLYLIEAPGKLDDHAIAARLSYMLTGSTPDDRLAQLANEGRLRDPAILRGEVERLLSDNGGRQFVNDLADQWLDLDQIDFTQPDRKLVPDFDTIVQESMLAETQAYLATMLREDLSVAHLIDSDFTFLNSRLARFYDIEGVEGDTLQRFSLKPEYRRGGVLTQGAILKVTANGSNTSPVIRGVWVSERLLGETIPPPPANVPAVEPDIRGAKTIRQLLAKHRSEDSCASCHVKIDPPGFALENYDPAGRWRDRYVRLSNGRRDRGAEVDASYVMPTGEEFEDVDEFRALLVARPRQLARNVAEKLVVYGTGAPISFADREAIEQIVDQAAEENYGFRSLVQTVVTSSLFLSK